MVCNYHYGSLITWTQTWNLTDEQDDIDNYLVMQPCEELKAKFDFLWNKPQILYHNRSIIT